MDSEDLRNILRIHLAERVGAALYQRLLERFGSCERIFSAGVEELAQVHGMGAKTAAAFVRSRDEADVDGELAAAERVGVRVVTYLDDEYPRGLNALPNPPLVLYVRGEVLPKDILSVAIVGSRRCTQYGLSQAQRLAAGLATVGATVMSGLARGIDAAAHWAAIRAQGRTIAVVGNGLGKTYPPEHRELADAIADSGAVVSELPIATPPSRTNFPPRNRIISAMSLGVVVVEAARRSGAMITAKWANEQGKEVFAVPGPVDSPTSRGPHHLIRQGAKLVESCPDILEELGPLAPAAAEFAEDQTDDARTLAMTEQEKKVFALLSPSAPKSIDEIIEESGLPASQASSTLTILEIKRCVRRVSGQRFVRA